MPVGRLSAVVLVAVFAVGCRSECGSSVYPDYPEMDLRSATATTQGEVGPPLPYEQVEDGSGRVVVYGRKITLRASFSDSAGRSLGAREVTVLFPRFDRERFGHAGYGIDSGEMPVYFEPMLAGMRVGTKRRFTMPVHTRPEPWALRGIGEADPLAITGNEPVTTESEVRSVCKPKICMVTTWSIPSSRNQRVVEKGCR